jgi:peptidyl-Asp metalloendopeptidase
MLPRVCVLIARVAVSITLFGVLFPTLVYADPFKHVIIKMKEHATSEDKASVKAQLDATTVKPLDVKGTELWTVPANKLGEIKTIAKQPEVQYIESTNSPLDALLVKATGIKLDPKQSANLALTTQMTAQVQPILVRMDASQFKMSLLADVANPAPLTIPVSANKTLRIDTQRLLSRGTDSYTVIGNVLGDSGVTNGDAVLSVTDGKLVGTLTDGADTYSVKPLGADVYVVTKLDRAKLPTDEPADADNPPGAKATPADKSQTSVKSPETPKDVPMTPPSSSAADGSSTTVSVLVAYTKAVAASDPAIGATIQNDIDITNKTYADSQIPLVLKLVGTHQEDYVETTYKTDLSRLVAPNDGFMDDIHSLRRQQQADVVVLIVKNPAFCGLSEAIRAAAPTAFSLVNYDCAGVNYSLAHELGHLFGARHDYCMDQEADPYAYGHGYILSAKNVRTIMAYPNCSGVCT